MDKEKIKNDFKSLIGSISSEVINSSVFKLLEKIKQEISDLSAALAQQVKSFSKVSSEVPAKIEEKLGQFDKLQKEASGKIEKNNKRLKDEVDRMIENNSKLETNFNNNFSQLRQANELLQKKVMDLTKLVNILIIIVAFIAIGVLVNIVQNQKIVSIDRTVTENIVKEPEEMAEVKQDQPEESEAEEEINQVEIDLSINYEDRISNNTKEINKLWNSYSKLNNRVKSIGSTDKLESRFETRFTALENKTTTTDEKLGNLESSFYEKLDNIWKFLAEKGTSKMKSAING